MTDKEKPPAGADRPLYKVDPPNPWPSATEPDTIDEASRHELEKVAATISEANELPQAMEADIINYMPGRGRSLRKVVLSGPSLGSLLYREPVKVLDHGYLTFIESWGSDERIIETARMSTDGAFKGWGPNACPQHCINGVVDFKVSDDGLCPKCNGDGVVPGDEKLLAYLWSHKHSTPFEFAGLTIEVQAPIFVYRQWHRHRTFSYNELSARYTVLPEMFYMPSIERLKAGRVDDSNRQGSSSLGDITDAAAGAIQEQLGESYALARQTYEKLLRDGVASELARCCMPVAQYSRMRASGNLGNWLKFLTLRMDSHAQWEIRQFANAVGDLIAMLYPRTWALFNLTGPVTGLKTRG